MLVYLAAGFRSRQAGRVGISVSCGAGPQHPKVRALSQGHGKAEWGW